MPTAIALRSFDHNGKVRKGDTVEFDAVTMAALRRSGLVSKDDVEAPKLYTEGVANVPMAGTYLLDKGEKVVRPKKPGKKSAASRAAPASPPPIATPSAPGELPPPPPVA